MTEPESFPPVTLKSDAKVGVYFLCDEAESDEVRDCLFSKATRNFVPRGTKFRHRRFMVADRKFKIIEALSAPDGTRDGGVAITLLRRGIAATMNSCIAGR